MKRVPVQPRENLENIIKQSGIIQTSKRLHDGSISQLWDETSAYVLSREDVNGILNQTSKLVKMSHEAVNFLLDGEWGTLGLSRSIFQYIRNSFDSEDLDLYTRYDFAYMPDGLLKLVNIESDSPRQLIETAHSQRVWLYDKFEDQASSHLVTQMNKIPEVSIEAFRRLRYMSENSKLYMANNSSNLLDEDQIATSFIWGLAQTAGWEPEAIRIKDAKWNAAEKSWNDLHSNKIEYMLKYFPWEVMLSQASLKKFITHEQKFSDVFEPSWKMMLSNRAILPALHYLYPTSKIISKAYIDQPYGLANEDYVQFSLLPSNSRNENGFLKGKQFTSWGDHVRDLSKQNFVGYRKLEVPQRFQNSDDIEHDAGRKMFTYISIFAVAGNIAGIGFRETKLPLLGINSTFRPHLVML